MARGGRLLKAIEKRIAGWLLAAGELSEKDLERVLPLHNGAKPLWTLLIEENVVSPKAVAKGLAEAHGFSFIDLKQSRSAPEALRLFSAAEAWRRRLVPVAVSESALTVALGDTNDVYTSDELRLRMGRRIEILIAEKADLEEALTLYYGRDPERVEKERQENQEEQLRSSSELHRLHQRRMRELRDSQDGKAGQSALETVIEHEPDPTTDGIESRVSGVRTLVLVPKLETPQNETPAVEPAADRAELELQRIIRCVLEARLHEAELAPSADAVWVRFRTATHWFPGASYPKGVHGRVLDLVRHVCGISAPWEDLMPGRRCDLRIGRLSIPVRLWHQVTAEGERLVLRFPSNPPLMASPLTAAGLGHDLANRLLARLRNGTGLLLLSSSTPAVAVQVLDGLLQLLAADPAREVVMLGETASRELAGVRAILRVGSDALLQELRTLGEMNANHVGVLLPPTSRGVATALQAAAQGPTVIATVSASSPEAVVNLVRSSNLDAGQRALALVGALHVDGLRKLCGNCCRAIEDRGSLPPWAREMEATFSEAVGCPDCNGSGYRDLLYVSEFLHADHHGAVLTAETDRHAEIVAACLAGAIDPRDYE